MPSTGRALTCSRVPDEWSRGSPSFARHQHGRLNFGMLAAPRVSELDVQQNPKPMFLCREISAMMGLGFGEAFGHEAEWCGRQGS